MNVRIVTGVGLEIVSRLPITVPETGGELGVGPVGPVTVLADPVGPVTPVDPVGPVTLLAPPVGPVLPVGPVTPVGPN